MVRSTTAVRGSVVPEYAGAALGDERRTRRLQAIAKRLEDDPRTAFPNSLHSTAELEAFYRLVNNVGFGALDILEPHRQRTLERASKSGAVLVVHDTTAAEFPGRTPRRGLGVTTEGKHGFLAHVALVVSTTEASTPLGVLGLDTFTRTGEKWRETKKTRSRVRDDPERESLRWWRSIEGIEKARQDRFEAIHVMDAEADFYELLCRMHSEGTRFVIRVGQQQRTLKDGEHDVSLREAADALKPAAWRRVELTSRQYAARRPRNQLKKHPPREARSAKLAIASTTIEVKQTKYSAIQGSNVRLNLVRIWEPQPPKGAPAVEWLLLTSEPATTRAELIAIVDMYRARWIIEEYFKALKTGCSLEQRQLDSYDALQRMLALFVPIAYRLLLLRGLERQRPGASPSTAFSAVELRIMRSQDSTREMPPMRTLADAMLYLARMGGHLKNNGPPGWQTLARGYQRLSALCAGWEAAADCA
jgi:Transposase DNA-binding/Transposase DDE domain